MSSRHVSMLAKRMLLAAAVVGLVCCLQTRPAPAAEPLKQLDLSLNWIPADAAYYNAMLRNGEQIDLVCKSRAWKSLIEMPAVKQGLRALRAKLEANEKAEQLKEAWENPEVRSALELLGDMFSQEVFSYGEPNNVDAVRLMQQVVTAVRFGPAFAQVTGKARRTNPKKLQAQAALSALAQNRDLIKIPSSVLGFRVKDTERAKEALIKLEMTFNIAAVAVPQLAGKLKRVKVGAHDYLTLSLDGKMIPWDRIPTEALENIEAEDGDAQKVIEKLKGLNLVLAVGLRGNYLLLSIGPSNAHLARLGQGKSLADLAEFKPLAKFADRRLVGIGYMSKVMAAAAIDNSWQINGFVKFLDRQLKEIDDLSAEQKAKIRKDAAALAKDVTRRSPQPGAMMSFNFLTDRGMEGYSYAWGRYPDWVASKPLSLLEHVGGSPLLMLVGRSRVAVEDYDLAIRWIKVAYGYFQEYGLPNIPPAQRDEFDKAVARFRPLLERFDRTNRTMLLPALADGQAGLVVDAKLKSRQFVRELPATEQPMPMAEPALLFGVSNADLLRKAMAEYRETLNASIDAARELSSGDFPPIRIPEPKVTKTSAGTLYCFPLPEEWGVTDEVKVVLGLSDRVALVGVTESQAERLLKSTPLAVGGVLAVATPPMAAAVALDWAATLNAATPWVDYALRQALKDRPRAAKPARPAKKAISDQDPGKKPKPKKGDGAKAKPTKGAARKLPDRSSIADQVHAALKLLQVLRTVTAQTYQDDNAMVNHSLVEIRDID